MSGCGGQGGAPRQCGSEQGCLSDVRKRGARRVSVGVRQEGGLQPQPNLILLGLPRLLGCSLRHQVIGKRFRVSYFQINLQQSGVLGGSEWTQSSSSPAGMLGVPTPARPGRAGPASTVGAEGGRKAPQGCRARRREPGRDQETRPSGSLPSGACRSQGASRALQIWQEQRR